MASGSPDLFVICKHCGMEVSPYITECPYCGNRIQKRAPKLDRDGRIAEKLGRRAPTTPTLPRLRRGEIPGIRHDTHPYGTVGLLILGFLGTLLWRTNLINVSDLVANGRPGTDIWRLFTSPFIYDNTGYAILTLAVIALFGTLLERRHGPLVVVGLFLAGGVIGTLAGVETSHTVLVTIRDNHVVELPHLAMGANGAAIALACAWAVPDLLTLRSGEEIEGDLIGAAVLAAVIALMPLVAPEAAWVAGAVGVVAGLLLGLLAARLHPA